MAEMKQEPLETQMDGLVVAEDMELVDPQVGIKDDEDLEDKVKEKIEPLQRIETLDEMKVEIPPDSTPICCSNSRLIYCSDCGRNFTKESQLQRHKCFVRHENLSSNIQSKKTPLSKDPDALLKHREKSHNISPFICSECGKHFISKISLVKHKTHHFEGNRHKCSDCDDGFPTIRKLKDHMKTHINSFVCLVCEKTFKQEYGLTKHMESHVEERPFKCSLCEKSFMSQRELLQHQKNRHDICPLCSERFSDQENMKKHLKSHPSTEVEAYEKPFKCSECGSRFSHACYLLQHQMSVHSEETPFKCPVCQKRFKSKLYFTSHYEREHPFECSLCKKNLKTKQALSTHMSFHNCLATENQDESMVEMKQEPLETQMNG